MKSLVIIGTLCWLAGTPLVSAGSAFDEVKLLTSAFAFGQCHNENVKVLQALDVAKYNGTWFEIFRVPFIFEVLMKCVTADYTFHPENQTVGVLNRGYRMIFNKWSDAVGTAQVETAAEPAKLVVQFDQAPASQKGSYWVLDTDYANYSVVFSCTELGPFRAKYAWILSRTSQPLSADLQTKLFKTLTDNGVDTSTLYATDQTDCPPRK